MKKKVSLKQIAEKVGVSIALVSYVLNNQKEGRIRKEVAQKIRDTARELNYTTNQIARSLKMKKTFTIGLLVADISNPFFSKLARIIEDEAEKEGYTVLFGSSDEKDAKMNRLVNVFLDRQVDGLILAPAENSEAQIRSLQEGDVPFVLIDRYFPALETNYIVIDNYEAAFTAVDHLIRSGKKRIGLVSYQTRLFNLLERRRGYTEALLQNGLPVPEARLKEISMEAAAEEAAEAVAHLLQGEEPADAILFTSNVLSTYGLKYINTLPLQVPDDLAIVSFDESDAAELFYAPLTHIRQPLQEIGRLATQTLLGQMRTSAACTGISLKAAFVIGKSTGPVPEEKEGPGWSATLPA